MSNVVCLFHDDCFDGLGAAWALSKRFPDAEYHNVRYKEPPPAGLNGKIVYIVDFCYPLASLIEISVVAEEVHILDHHKGMAETIEQFNETMRLMGYDQTKFNGVFDITRSGALLTWETLHPDYPAPMIIHYISDRDLWAKQYEETSTIMAGLGSYPMDLALWDRMFHWDPSYHPADTNHPHHAFCASLEADGPIVERKMSTDIERLITIGQRSIQLGDYTVPLINIPRMLVSEALEGLARQHPFAVGYFDTENYREFSLRSTKGKGVDVIEIARLYGGGGHTNAAGFRVDRDHELAKV